MRNIFWGPGMFPVILTAALLALAGRTALVAEENNQADAAITGHFSPRNFAPGAVSQADTDRILAAAVRAPSAGNRQPWHFSVIRQTALVRRVVPAAEEGNILIIVSVPGAGNAALAGAVDAALAAQSMYLAAQTLDLASRLYTGPINTINGMKNELGVPAANTAVIMVRIGRMPPGVDAVSGASSRREISSFVTYK